MYLITGASGNVGRHIVAQLHAQGLAVRVLSRTPEKLSLPKAIAVMPGDLSQPDTLVPALEGVTTAFLFAVPNSAPGFVAAAKRAGVNRVVFLSSNGVEDGIAQQRDPIAAFHAEIEQTLEASGLRWTMIRPSTFAANALQWQWSIRSAGRVSLPFTQAASAPVHEADIAAVAVQALINDRHAGARYQVTGPESLTQIEQIQILADVLGRPLEVDELAPDVARAHMVQHVPVPIVDALFTIWAQSVGKPAFVSDTVERVTGKPAHTFQQWAVDHCADFQ
ncbi:MAG: NAD(P)H-binding protein [Anaerolineae bacterium]|nr:NAD(P)H-binding protein [Anaerolineae bacterium]